MFRLLRLILIMVIAAAGISVTAQDETPVPETEATATLEADTNAYVRVVHFAADAGEVDVFIDSERSGFEGLAYQQFGDWTAVAPGEHNVTVAPAGATLAEALLNPVSVELAAGTWTTLVVLGTADGVNIMPVQEAYDELLPGTAGLTVVNLAQGTPPLNFIRDNIVYISDLNYLGEQDVMNITSFRIDAGMFDMQFVEPEAPDTPLIDLSQTEIPENTYMFIAVTGTPGNLEAVTEATDLSEVEIARGELEPPGTIMNAVQADENLTSLATALESTGLAQELSGEGQQYTLFAPANFVLDGMDTSDPQALETLLRGHIVEGRLTSRDVFNAGSLSALDGTQLEITAEGNNVFVNGAQIIDVNIPATNGVIHMLNGIAQQGS